jgi:hypothetical protein
MNNENNQNTQNHQNTAAAAGMSGANLVDGQPNQASASFGFPPQTTAEALANAATAAAATTNAVQPAPVPLTHFVAPQVHVAPTGMVPSVPADTVMADAAPRQTQPFMTNERMSQMGASLGIAPENMLTGRVPYPGTTPDPRQMCERLEKEIAELRRSAAAPSSSGPQRRPSNPAPAKFDGKTSWERWRLTFDTWARAEELATQAQVWSAMNLLAPDILQFVDDERRRRYPDGQFSLESLDDIMRAGPYHRKDTQLHIRNILMDMRQGSKPLSQFLSEFERVLREAKDMDAQTKIWFLKRALRKELVPDPFVNHNTQREWEDYNAARQFVIHMDSSFGPATRGPGTHLGPAGMANPATRSTRPETKRPPSDKQNGDAKRPKLTEQDKLTLRKEGRCFYCREKGHTAETCPKKAKN